MSARDPEPPTSAARRELAVTAAVFALALAVYLASPVRRFLDPRYTALTAESLATRGSWDLSPYFAASIPDVDGDAAPESPPAGRRGRLPRGAWQVERVGDRLLLWYPPGTPLLSAPIVGLLRVAGVSAVGPDGRFRAAGENRQHAVVAALVAAATVALVLRLARRELPLGAASAVALAAAFGTSLWSIASRALWSHGWSALLVAAAWLELVRWDDGERRRPVLLGALLAAAFWVRPTDALVAVAGAGYVAWRHRAALPALVATGAAGLAGFVALAWSSWGSWLPPYYRLAADAGLDGIAARAAGLLVSPARGLLAFTPALAAVPWMLARGRLPAGRSALLATAGALVGGHLVLYASWRLWWGGATYGPRLWTDLVPVLAWIAALAVRAARDPRTAPLAPPARTLAAIALVLLVGWGVVAHGAGALSPRVTRAVREADRPAERLWDWRLSPPLLVARGAPPGAP